MEPSRAMGNSSVSDRARCRANAVDKNGTTLLHHAGRPRRPAVLKASEIYPRTHAAIVHALQDAGLPPGVLNLITAAGRVGRGPPDAWRCAATSCVLLPVDALRAREYDTNVSTLSLSWCDATA